MNIFFNFDYVLWTVLWAGDTYEVGTANRQLFTWCRVGAKIIILVDMILEEVRVSLKDMEELAWWECLEFEMEEQSHGDASRHTNSGGWHPEWQFGS